MLADLIWGGKKAPRIVIREFCLVRIGTRSACKQVYGRSVQQNVNCAGVLSGDDEDKHFPREYSCFGECFFSDGFKKCLW